MKWPAELYLENTELLCFDKDIFTYNLLMKVKLKILECVIYILFLCSICWFFNRVRSMLWSWIEIQYMYMYTVHVVYLCRFFLGW